MHDSAAFSVQRRGDAQKVFPKSRLAAPLQTKVFVHSSHDKTLTVYLCIHVIVMALDHLLDLVRDSLSSLLTHLLILDVCL